MEVHFGVLLYLARRTDLTFPMKITAIVGVISLSISNIAYFDLNRHAGSSGTRISSYLATCNSFDQIDIQSLERPC